MTATLRKCLYLVGPDRRVRWALLLALAVLVSVLEAFGAGLVFLLIGVITGAEESLILPIIGDVARFMPAAGDEEGFVVVASVVGTFFLVRGGLLLGQVYIQHRMTEKAGARLSARLLHNYLAVPYGAHLQRNSAELIRNAFDTVQSFVKDGLTPAVRVLSESFVVLGILGVLVVTSLTATLFAVVGLLPLGLLLVLVIHPRVKALGRTSQEMSRMSLQTLQQSLGGWRDIKVLGRERFFEREFTRRRFRLARSRYLRSTAADAPRIVIETMLVLFVLTFLGFTVTLGDGLEQALPILGLFGYAALRIQPSLNKIFESTNRLKFSGPAVDDLYHDVLTCEEQARAGAAADAVEPLAFDSELLLEDVGYRYTGAETEALSDINLVIARGEAIGIVGPTGGGKSTLVDVILGLLEPTRGRLLVDGIDMRTCVSAWQRRIGMVPQSIYLTDDTLRRNVALGIDEKDINDARVLEAVRMAQLGEFVAALPNGLDTMVGERGVRLSGGQRQRVAIARALYREPEVLVFDEATSALDTATEAAFMATLRDLHRDRTLILVAHRLSTVHFSDRVVVVKDGRIVDTGPYAELEERNKDFQQLVTGGAQGTR